MKLKLSTLFIIALLLVCKVSIGQISLFTLDQTTKADFGATKPASLSGSTIKAPDVTYLELDKKNLSLLYKDDPAIITIAIPRYNKPDIEITLQKKQILSNHFSVKTLSKKGQEKVTCPIGHYYNCISEGKFAAISVFENSIQGVLTIEGEQYSIGPIDSEVKATTESPLYVMVKDADLPSPESSCQTADIDIPQNMLSNLQSPAQFTVNDDRLIYTYVEAEHEFLADYGGVVGTFQHISNIWNVVHAIYELEEIDMQISEIVIWTEANSYDHSNLYSLRQDFSNSKTCLHGDLAIYLEWGNFFGGVAGSEICSGQSFALASIKPDLLEFPNFSRAPFLVAHELGHMLGSPHTHSCSWPGGVIDNCATPQDGNCGPSSNPTPGTIMSYCPVSVMDFNLGFGDLPGDLIRATIDNSDCHGQIEYIDILGDDIYACTDEVVTLDATFPSCNNCTYFWNDGATGPTREVTTGDNYDYCVQIVDATGNIYADHILVTGGGTRIEAELNFPSSCTEGDILINASSTYGNFSYNWSNGNTTNFLQDVEAGSYTLTLTNDECTVTRTYDLVNAVGIEMEKRIGSSDLDEVQSIIENSNNELMIFGTGGGPEGELNYPAAGFIIMNADKTGDINWVKNIGSPGSETCNDAIATQDGGYLMVGTTYGVGGDIPSNNGGKDGILVKTNQDGDVEWVKNIGGSNDDIIFSVLQLPNGEYVFCGSTSSNDFDLSENLGSADMWVAKASSSGDIIWSKNFGGSRFEKGADIAIDDENDIYVLGSSSSNDGDFSNNSQVTDVVLLKLDQNGTKIWAKNYGGIKSDDGSSVLFSSEGYIVFSARSTSRDNDLGQIGAGRNNIWLCTTDKDGNLLSSNAYTTPNNVDPSDLLETDDGGFILVGAQESLLNSPSELTYDAYLIKTDINGNLEWKKIIGTDTFDKINTIIQSADGNFYVGGSSAFGISYNTPYFAAPYEMWFLSLSENAGVEVTIEASDLFLDNGPVILTANPPVPSPVWSTGATTQSISINSPGTYTLTGGVGNCENMDQVTIAETGCIVDVSTNGCEITLTGLNDAVSNIKVFNSNYSIVWECNPWSGECNETEVISGLDPGVYPISIKTEDANGEIICDFTESFIIDCQGGPCLNEGGDSDNDGICDDNDCAPLDPAFPLPVGSPCNDGDPTTTEDQIQSDGCTCMGTPIGNTACGVSFSVLGNSITLTGMSGAESIKLFLFGNGSPVFQCGSQLGNDCSNTATVDGLAAGDYTLIVIMNNCTENASFEIDFSCVDGDNDGVCLDQDCDDSNPSIPATVGSSCDDGNPETENDMIQSDACTCAGVPVSNTCSVVVSNSNNSIVVTGLTNAENTKLFDSDYTVVWSCNPWSGSPCSSSETIDNLITGATYYLSVQSDVCDEWISIVVEGTNCTDMDNDGVCLDQDCDDSNPSIPATVGSSCDDGNPETESDMIQSDACTCAGVPVSNTCSVVVSNSNNSIVVTGLTNAENTKLFDSDYTVVWSCDPWSGNPCSSIETIDNLIVGATYYLSVQSDVCDEWITIVAGGTNCTDMDNDGVCIGQDCDDGNPSIPATVGSSCDDGNPNTTNDVIQPDGCTCLGIPDDENLCNIAYSLADGTMIISGTGLEAPNNVILKLFDPNWQILFECTGDCDDNIIIPNISTGIYHLSVNVYDVNWNPTCDFLEDISVENGSLRIGNINEITLDQDRSIVVENMYPVPASSWIFIEISSEKEAEILTEIYDSRGSLVSQKLLKINVGSNVIQWNIDELPSGFYQVLFNVGNRHNPVRFIKQRL